MADNTNPSEIARETLRRLALTRLPPTPENFRVIYHEIAGSPSAELFPERGLKVLTSALPRATPDQLRFCTQLDAAVATGTWSAVTGAMVALVQQMDGAPRSWAGLIRDTLFQFERRHGSLTTDRKREMIEQVLAKAGNDPDQLFQRLQGLVSGWSLAIGDRGNVAAVGAPAAPETCPGPQCDTSTTLRGALANLLECSVQLVENDLPEVRTEAEALAREARTMASAAQLPPLLTRAHALADRLQWVAEDQHELRQALISLLQLILENVSELLLDDSWMRGQIDVLRELIANPLNARQVDDVERRLRELIDKQSALKNNLSSAKNQIKAMLAGFVDHLASFTASTGDYHDRMGVFAEHIAAADSIQELGEVVSEVLQATHAMRDEAARSRDELQAMQQKVENAELEISRLQSELAQTSQMMRHDQLTGALNRKGLEETFVKEVARAQRRAAPLCLAVLDLDNFKRLNDTYGHHTGDEALIHLAQVVRQTLRPQDTLARYGGEEFIILLPETNLEDAVQALTRLQRALTKEFFLARNEKLLITFSAGVTPVGKNEAQAAVIKRADEAMYLAKQTGKNRVVPTPLPPGFDAAA
jgi:diguanylate cyclase